VLGCDLHVVHVCRAAKPVPGDELADLVAPICGFDPARMHVVCREPDESIGASARDLASGIVVLGSQMWPNVLLNRIVRQVLPVSSALIVDDRPPAGASMPCARRRPGCAADR
jgi:hypothetical protein